MRNQQSAIARRRHNARSLPKKSRRRFRVEHLEDRRMLASDFLQASALDALAAAEGEGDDLVAIRLATTDLSGNPIEAVAAGQRFLLQASVEDLRDDPAGVFAAYLDVEFDASRAAILGPVVHAEGFQNGTSGDLSFRGLIDEVGGFGTSLTQPGVAVAQLFSVVVTADTVGQLVFESEPADLLPEHDMLLYQVNTPISHDMVDYGRVAIDVTPFVGHPDVDANDDAFDVLALSAENRLDVLHNDAGFGELIVAAVDATGLSGEVEVAADGRGVVYTPGTDFVGTERFSYTAMDGNGTVDDAFVTVNVRPQNPSDDVVAIRLAATDTSGAPITTIADGGEFLLSAYVQDLRAEPQGVFAAYMDLAYDLELVATVGALEFGPDYVNGTSGSLEVPGLVDEVGAFHQSIRPADAGEALLFSIPFIATGSGQAVFHSSPADELPDHAVLIYGADDFVPEQQIAFGRLALEIRSDVTAVDDSFHVPEDATAVFDVLGNDVHQPGDPLRIRGVDASSIRGTVTIAADGRSLSYTPAAGFGGTEQFTYVAEGRRGVDSAQVTVHTEPGTDLDDVLAIDLATVDAAGNRITSIEAGQDFWLTASVDDLRNADRADLGVFAAYFDLLYDADRITVVPSDANKLGFDVSFGAEYLNGQSGQAEVPGIIDEFGAFQTSSQPVGPDSQELFTVHLRALSGSSGGGTFVVQEDVKSAVLDVLANYVPNVGPTIIRSDPADQSPVSDVLLFEPPDVVSPAEIRFGEAPLQIVSNPTASITSAGATSAGGSVVISADGQSVLYTPAPDFFGVESFSYSIDQGPLIPVEVRVEGVADAPQAEDDQYHVRANHRLTISQSAGPLANDTDADGDHLTVLLDEPPAHGSLDLDADGAFVYIPDPGYVGSDQFTYRAFDRELASAVATVEIEVEPPPVRIRLQVVDATGAPQTHATAGQTLLLQAWVQDQRGDSQSIHGVGAAYLDIGFDLSQVHPVMATSGEFDLAIEFGPDYQNGTKVALDANGLDEVGAFQAGLAPLGPNELELFTIQMEFAGLQTVADEFSVSGNSRVNRLDVLANEIGLTWDVPFDANPADNRPLSDVVLFDPPVALADEDVALVDTVITVSNDASLRVVSAGTNATGRSANGGSVVVADGGSRIDYVPPQGFTGIDTFEYSVVDANGAVGTGSVTIEVIQGWQNQLNRFDVNSDGFVTSSDVLVLINDLNRNGARNLPTEYLGPHFFDVNGDGFISPQDVLAVLNFLNRQSIGSPNGLVAEGEAPARQRDEWNLGLAGDELNAVLGFDPAESLQRVGDSASLSNFVHRDEVGPSFQRVLQSVAVVNDRLQAVSDRSRSPDDLPAVGDLVEGLDDFVDEVAELWDGNGALR